MRMVGIIIAALLANAPALGQEQAPPPASAPPDDAATIHNYGSIEKTCLRWTDGCRTCARETDDKQVCSNIGIACQPAAIICTTRREAAAPK
jgi:hypothetical protein